MNLRLVWTAHYKVGEERNKIFHTPVSDGHGGFCAMEGEDSKSDDERAFGTKPEGGMIAVCAGAVMNIILGIHFWH